MDSSDITVIFGGNIARWEYEDKTIEISVNGPISFYRYYHDECLIAFVSGSGKVQKLTGFKANGKKQFSSEPPMKGQFIQFCEYFNEPLVVLCAYYQIGWNQGYFAFSPKDGKLRFINEAR